MITFKDSLESGVYTSEVLFNGEALASSSMSQHINESWEAYAFKLTRMAAVYKALDRDDLTPEQRELLMHKANTL